MGINRERAEEVYRLPGLGAPDAADTDHLPCIAQRHARQARLEHRPALAHALARLGEAARTECAFQHVLDAFGMLRLFGDQLVGQCKSLKRGAAHRAR
ncbi:MAG: hypothetical protein M0D54_03350 [Hyphomonadaceae bacterium JAD_PAG50586_4]|nr:MAG: hypothetical protein M0D54_03350 [Hyphomonadaceae bacterium JAD_PAG50586_4]